MILAPAGLSGATQLSDAQAKAAQLQAEITATNAQVEALDQQYDAAVAQKAQLDQQIASTEAQMAKTRARIARDRATLRTAAVKAYVTGGSAEQGSALFAGNQTAGVDAKVFDQVMTGNLTSSVDQLNTAIAQLGAQQKTLKSEDAQAAQAVATAHSATEQAQTLEAQEQTALSQVNGQIATLMAAQQAQEAAVQAAATAAKLAAAPKPVYVPPPVGGNAGTVAVAAAETQLGVPYVWGGETPGVGFDCSGLVAWAWGQAGVYLPHYSGAQFQDSTPVPVTDLQPGDLLFYGPGGSQHVAMYVGGGEMIEAPHTGTVVRIDPIRLGDTFAGAGRP